MKNRIFCLLGKSSSGKDRLFKVLLADESLGLRRLVPYTTRPIRTGEQEGREYHFVTVEQYRELHNAGKIAEERVYETVHGPWWYFTAADSSVNLKESSYILIGTLEAYVSLAEYCRKHISDLGADETAGSVVEPIYIEVEDGERLERALRRERKEEHPKYAEMCRRFLADTADFSTEKLLAAGIREENTFENPTGEFKACEEAVKARIRECIGRTEAV